MIELGSKKEIKSVPIDISSKEIQDLIEITQEEQFDLLEKLNDNRSKLSSLMADYQQVKEREEKDGR